MSRVEKRKDDHLRLCAEEEVESRSGTLLDEVHLLHDALPELSLAEIDPSVEILGRRLAVPLMISGMTGGTERAKRCNRAFARAAQEAGLAMGVGSQRPMLESPELVSTYRVREVAPDVLLFANIGIVQARDSGPARVRELADAIEADAICLHLNAAQELVQDEGDRDFRGCLDTIATIVSRQTRPVIVKETGCGLAPRTLRRLAEAGVHWVDVAGAGGTSWPGVESFRGSDRQRLLGGHLHDWGVPTAASVVYARRAGLRTIASGGLRSPVDVLRALALGASLCGMALPFLRGFHEGGESGVVDTAAGLVEGVRALMLLAGVRRIGDVEKVPLVIGPQLRAWIGEGRGREVAPSFERTSAETTWKGSDGLH